MLKNVDDISRRDLTRRYCSRELTISIDNDDDKLGAGPGFWEQSKNTNE